METGLSGKVAVVTGGARDVGGEVCRALAGEGVKVVVNYNSSKDEADRRVGKGIRYEIAKARLAAGRAKDAIGILRRLLKVCER